MTPNEHDWQRRRAAGPSAEEHEKYLAKMLSAWDDMEALQKSDPAVEPSNERPPWLLKCHWCDKLLEYWDPNSGQSIKLEERHRNCRGRMQARCHARGCVFANGHLCKHSNGSSEPLVTESWESP